MEVRDKTIGVTVRGFVQGVGFRWFTQRLARQLGLRGWVRNEPDGSVRVVACGPLAALERFIEGVRRGPSYAKVVDLEWEELKEEPPYQGFEILF